MSRLPRFIFPDHPESSDSTPVTGGTKERPQIYLSTTTGSSEEKHIAVPNQTLSGSLTLRIVSTPPDSPTPLRITILEPQTPVKMHNSGAITPPPTPTKASHAKTNSSSSDFLTTISSLRRGDSLSSHTGRPSLDVSRRPGNTDAIRFPHHTSDYKYRTNDDGKKKPIGVGAWSEVYLAKPRIPELAKEFAFYAPTGSDALTPPITPVHSRDASIHDNALLSVPPLYAIKVPGSTSAKKVLTAEARILSYLTRFPSADQHIVQFYGQDIRNGALVLKAMDGTLEDWIAQRLNSLNESSRAATLVTMFPTTAVSLLDSLFFIHSRSCIHADIKPSNILFTNPSPVASQNSIPSLVFSDFSSSILVLPSTSPSLSSDEVPSPLGAGTWTYLDPTLLSTLNPSSPSHATDLYSLAMTLLYLIIGSSPFDAFKHNQFQLREMVKSGSPLDVMAYDDIGARNVARMKALSKALGWDVRRWLGKVLKKRVGDRVGVGEWRQELMGTMGVEDSKI